MASGAVLTARPRLVRADGRGPRHPPPRLGGRRPHRPDDHRGPRRPALGHVRRREQHLLRARALRVGRPDPARGRGDWHGVSRLLARATLVIEVDGRRRRLRALPGRHRDARAVGGGVRLGRRRHPPAARRRARGRPRHRRRPPAPPQLQGPRPAPQGADPGHDPRRQGRRPRPRGGRADHRRARLRPRGGGGGARDADARAGGARRAAGPTRRRPTTSGRARPTCRARRRGGGRRAPRAGARSAERPARRRLERAPRGARGGGRLPPRPSGRSSCGGRRTRTSCAPSRQELRSEYQDLLRRAGHAARGGTGPPRAPPRPNWTRRQDIAPDVARLRAELENVERERNELRAQLDSTSQRLEESTQAMSPLTELDGEPPRRSTARAAPPSGPRSAAPEPEPAVSLADKVQRLGRLDHRRARRGSGLEERRAPRRHAHRGRPAHGGRPAHRGADRPAPPPRVALVGAPRRGARCCWRSCWSRSS